MSVCVLYAKTFPVRMWSESNVLKFVLYSVTQNNWTSFKERGLKALDVKGSTVFTCSVYIQAQHVPFTGHKHTNFVAIRIKYNTDKYRN